MRTRSVAAPANGRDDRRRGAGSGRAGGHGGTRWRSHTFSDGVYAITLARRLDARAAIGLHARLRELIGRGCKRLILDLSATGVSGAQERLWLAAIFEAHAPSCEVVVVAGRRLAPSDALPAGVAVARTLSDARRRFGFRPEQRDVHPRAAPAPAGRISMDERRALSTRQSLRWADRAAAQGDYEHALASLAMVEAAEGSLPEDSRERSQAWRSAVREQAAEMRAAPRLG